MFVLLHGAISNGFRTSEYQSEELIYFTTLLLMFNVLMAYLFHPLYTGARLV